MNYTTAKNTIELIDTYINGKEDYFGLVSFVKIVISNRDLAIKQGQKIDKKHLDNEYLKAFLIKDFAKKTFKSTALSMYNAIKRNDKAFLKERVRYDQKLSKDLYELYTGIKVPKTNKEIAKIF